MATKKANGNITPSRFVKSDVTGDNFVLQAGASATIVPYGIAAKGTRNTPYSTLDDGFAAIVGENIRVHDTPGEVCLLELGATVVRGDLLKSDANGKGITANLDKDAYGARALVSGAAGDLIWVEIEKGFLAV